MTINDCVHYWVLWSQGGRDTLTSCSTFIFMRYSSLTMATTEKISMVKI
jgi:hypothetical protein